LRAIRIGRYAVPLWLIALIMVSLFGSVMGYIVWKTLTISVEVKEPIDILSYPTQVSLYPGETFLFNISVDNHASINYTVLIDFNLDNTTYQNSYATFSNQIYTVVPGQQNVPASINVASDAPAANFTLTINFSRGVYPYGLVGYWKFDEGTGTIVSDSSGNDNNGVLVNGPVWVDGKYGKALSFDGIDDYVMIPDSQNLRVQNFTLEAWVYMTVRPYQAGHPGHPHVCIVNKLHYYNNPAPTGYKLDFEYPSATDDTLVVTVGDGVAQRFLVQYNSINDLTLNQWHQIVGTYDGSTAKIYIDGQLKATGQGSYRISHDSTPLCFSREVSQPIYDGFNGIIDNVLIYNRALSAEEVNALYTGPV
jgi:hypothetical protein